MDVSTALEQIEKAGGQTGWNPPRRWGRCRGCCWRGQRQIFSTGVPQDSHVTWEGCWDPALNKQVESSCSPGLYSSVWGDQLPPSNWTEIMTVASTEGYQNWMVTRRVLTAPGCWQIFDHCYHYLPGKITFPHFWLIPVKHACCAYENISGWDRENKKSHSPGLASMLAGCVAFISCLTSLSFSFGHLKMQYKKTNIAWFHVKWGP